MEASTTIKQMLAGNRIFVPAYQRAYSWDTEFESSKAQKQVNTFLSDLEDYNRSSTKSKYYFGHFLCAPGTARSVETGAVNRGAKANREVTWR